MKKQLIRISILQSSKIMTALYVVMGFMYTLIGIPMVIFGSGQFRIIGIIYLLGPVLAGILGFLFFVIFAAIYNLLVKWLGGFELEIKNIDSLTSQSRRSDALGRSASQVGPSAESCSPPMRCFPGEGTMSNKIEGILNSMAAILTLFTTLLDPWMSIGLAVVFLLGLGIYHFARSG